MLCKYCSAEIVDANATHCEYCGKPIERESTSDALGAQPVDPATQAQQAQAQLQQIPTSGGGRRIAIIVVAVVVIAALVAFFGARGCSGDSDGATSSETASAEAAFAGEWELESGTSDGLSEENIARARTLDLRVTLTLDEGGTGTFSLFNKASDVTWKIDETNKGTVTFDDGSMTMELAGGKLVLTNEISDTMTFAPASAYANPSSASSMS